MRQAFAVPLCYFPSLVLFLDNGHDFLLNVLLHLNEQIAYRWFDVPMEALDFIHHYPQKYGVISRRCAREYQEALDTFAFHMDEGLAPLYAEMYNPYRFSELAVMVIDSHARGMDGFEFCRRVGHTMTKKLLLIYPEEEKKAQEALRAGVIDGYLDKKNPGIIERIHQEIHRLQMDYFLAMSYAISRTLGVVVSDCLRHPMFQALMKGLIARHHIAEYYLIDREGSFLLLDEDANPSILIVNSFKKAKEYVLFAMMHGASDELIDALARGEKMPCPFVGSEQSDTWLAWQESLIFSAKIEIDEGLVVTYLPAYLLRTLRDRKILSYHRYLNELDAEELTFI